MQAPGQIGFQGEGKSKSKILSQRLPGMFQNITVGVPPARS